MAAAAYTAYANASAVSQAPVLPSGASTPQTGARMVQAPTTVYAAAPKVTQVPGQPGQALMMTTAQPQRAPSFIPPVAVQYVDTAQTVPAQVQQQPQQQMATMNTGAPLGEPVEPQRLTAGLPEPSAIAAQRAAYTKALDVQLTEGNSVLSSQLKQQTEYLHQVGEQQKRQYSLEVDQQMKSQEIQLVQQHNQQLLMLQQAAQQQKAALEQQANALLLDYNQKKASEDLAFQQYSFQKDQFEAQVRYTAEMKALQEQAAAAQNQVQQQQQAIAQQAMQATQQAALTQQQTAMAYAPLAPAPTTSYLPPMTMQAPSYQPPPVTMYGAMPAPTQVI